MKNYIDDYTDSHPIGGCLGLILVIALVVFAGPWIVMHAWSLIAVGMFGAPAMSYWTAFWGTMAFHILFARTSSGGKNG